VTSKRVSLGANWVFISSPNADTWDTQVFAVKMKMPSDLSTHPHLYQLDNVSVEAIHPAGSPMGRWFEVHFGYPTRCLVLTPSLGLDLKSATSVQLGPRSGRPDREPNAAMLMELMRDFRDLRQHVLVPITPLWQGFAINTAFYAGVWWCLIFGPRLVRRELLRRRGQCVMCAYSRAGLAEGAVCPECGS
jgi:hypothetical protein